MTSFPNEKRKITSPLSIKLVNPPLTVSVAFVFPRLSVDLLFPSSVKRSGILVESDIYFCYSKTLNDIQLNVNNFDLSNKIRNKIIRNENSNHPTSNTPDLMIQDGNSIYSPDLNLIIEYIEIQRGRGVKLIVDLPDCNVTQDGFQQIEFWSRYADLIVYHNPNVSISGNASKFLLWPGFPIPIDSYEFPWQMKENRLLLQGSRHRQREVFFQGVQRAHLPLVSQHHNLNAFSSISKEYVRYIDIIRSTKYIFTNGYLNSKESIIVGRAFETLASGSVLLYENGSKLSTFYSEYSDFLPIYNIADLIEKFEFLNSNDAMAREIGFNAKKRTEQLYNSRLFWSIALTMLGFI